MKKFMAMLIAICLLSAYASAQNQIKKLRQDRTIETFVSPLQQFPALLNSGYCPSFAGFSDEDWISNVSFAGIDNDSGYGPGNNGTGYNDFTGIFAQVEPGLSYPVSVTVKTDDGPWNERVLIWIDWNQNGVFDPSELTDLGTKSVDDDGEVFTGNIAVPSGALNGTTRMRVAVKYYYLEYYDDNINSWEGFPESYYLDPCVVFDINLFPPPYPMQEPGYSNFNFGEVEDYSVMVGPPVPLSDRGIYIALSLMVIVTGFLIRRRLF